MLYFMHHGDSQLMQASEAAAGDGTNVGSATTLYTIYPPVVYGAYVYFVDKGNNLCRYPVTGQGTAQNLNNLAYSSPAFMLSGSTSTMWFKGPSNALVQTNLDGSKVTMSNPATVSTPAVLGGYVYYCGTDGYIYFCDQTGYGPKVKDWNGSAIKGYTGLSIIAGAAGSSMYFMDSSANLWQTSAGAATATSIHQGSYGPPTLASDGKIYWRGYKYHIYRSNPDGTSAEQFYNYTTYSNPVADTNGGNTIYFQGEDSALYQVSVSDGQGNGTSHNYISYAPSETLPSSSGVAPLKYIVISLFYAPPGNSAIQTENTAPDSYVAYGSSVTTGTTNSTSSSFTDSANLSINLNDGEEAANLSFTASASLTQSSALELTSTQNLTQTIQGPADDGIDHGEDIFVLWLNPTLTVTQYQPAGNSWAVSRSDPTAGYFLVDVTVSELQDPSTMPAGTQQTLSDAGLTADDYATILSLNPFAANPNATISSVNGNGRYLFTGHYAQYEPPVQPNDSLNSNTYTISNEEIKTTSTEATVSYQVEITDAVGLEGIDDLSSTSSLSWSSSQCNITSTNSSTDSEVSITGPAYGYTGPVIAAIWWDTIYQSFAFELVYTYY